MFVLTDLLFKAALSLPDDGQVTLNYFLKGFQSQNWYWFFRAIFVLGLAISIFVFLYYRRRLKLQAECPAVEEDQSSTPEEVSLPPQLIQFDQPAYGHGQPKEGDGTISSTGI